MAITQKTSFAISAKPGPMSLKVETTLFTIISAGATWTAETDVIYNGTNVNVKFSISGIQNQAYAMVMTINAVDQEIKGKLTKDGKNTFTPTFPLATFNL